MSPKQSCLIALRQKILALELAPGAELDEASLCEAHGLSRTPLREVLQRLAGEGFVTLTAHRGATVASMDLARMRTFFQTAPMVYAGIARMAAERAERREIAALKDIQLGFARAVLGGDVSDASLLNHRFHAQIGAMAENPYLDAALGRMLIDHTRLSQTFYRAETREDESRISLASAQHDEMIEAFAARDGAWATDITLKHWELSQDSLERFVRPDPLPFELEALRDAV